MKKVLIILVLTILLSSLVYSVNYNKEIDNNIKNNKVKVIVHLKEKQSIDKFLVNKDLVYIITKNKKTEFTAIPGFAAEVTKEELESLKQNSNVKGIYLDKQYNLFLEETRPLINATEAIKKQFNNINITGKSQTVCVIDSGVNYTHGNFGGCSTSDFLSGNCSRILTGYDYIENDNDPYDSNGHGTHISGIIGAEGSLTGIAPEVNIIMIRACDGTSCEASDISSGLDFCIQNATTYNITAISMSLGSLTTYSNYCDIDSPFTSFINNAVEKNITVVASTGNLGSTTGISDPACIENVTSVASTYDFTGSYAGSCTDSAVIDKVSCFSNRNSITDLLAPGSKINSSYYDGKFSVMSGTSMATPMVSALVALLQQFQKLQENKTLTSYEIKEIMNHSGKLITDNGIQIPRINILDSLIYIDSKIPEVYIKSIENNIVYNKTNLTFNYTTFDMFLDSCFYNINYKPNITIKECLNSTITTDEINNTINFYVNDSKGNINVTSLEFFISSTNTYITSPGNNINSSNNNITFECNTRTAPGINLNNLTLYHNIQTDFKANLTYNIEGDKNSSSFMLNNIPDGNYIWNCLSDSNSALNNKTFASSNFTLMIDTKKPELLSIKNNSITKSEVTIIWETPEPANSKIYYGTTTDTTSESSLDSKTTLHSIQLTSLSTSTKYYYNVTSCDYVENCNISEQFYFNTSETSAQSPQGSSGSGSGGGGGGGSDEVITTQEEISQEEERIKEEPKEEIEEKIEETKLDLKEEPKEEIKKDQNKIITFFKKIIKKVLNFFRHLF